MEVETETLSTISDLPALAFTSIMEHLRVNDLLDCRLVSRAWNHDIILFNVLEQKSCFTLDGRNESIALPYLLGERGEETRLGHPVSDPVSPEGSFHVLSPTWRHVKLRRVTLRSGRSWLNEFLDSPFNRFKTTVTTLELLNCTMNWNLILQVMSEFVNLLEVKDSQDMYCWDYATFNSGLSEDEAITENPTFLAIPKREKLKNLSGLRKAVIHRSQLSECSTYVKMLSLYCCNLEYLEVTTDQNWQPARAHLFFNQLATLIRKNERTLKTLKFPYKRITSTYDFRLSDEHHAFALFLDLVGESPHWLGLRLKRLTHLGIQFSMVSLEEVRPLLKTKLIPLMQQAENLQELFIGNVYLTSGGESIISEFIEDIAPIKLKLGLYINDVSGIPSIESFMEQRNIQALAIQSYRESEKNIVVFMPSIKTHVYPHVIQFQYFGKHHAFKDWNLDLLSKSFKNLTHLNLVDHNSRLDTRHVCEALAILEDDDIQAMVKQLKQLVTLQIIGNLTFITDAGLTGLSHELCKQYFRSVHPPTDDQQHDTLQNLQNLVSTNKDMIGLPISNLSNLTSIVLRGVGIKITDLTAFKAFNQMHCLKKIHLFGSHQISATGRQILSHKFPVSKGCELQL